MVFDLPLFDANSAPALFYAPLPFLLWAAVRLGPAGTASALAVMVVVTIWGAVNGLGPFAGGTPQDTARDMQLFLIAVAVPLLLLAVVLEERAPRRARRARAAPAAHAPLPRGDARRALRRHRARAQPAAHRDPRATRRRRSTSSPTTTIDPEELAEILRDIIAADQRAGEVIRRLRALFKRGETQFQPLDANELVREVLGIVHGDLVTRAVEVVPAPRAAACRAIHGDRVELQQVMLNLVMNACEAMARAPRERPPAHHPHRARSTGGVQISFADRGPGFRAEQYAKLFEPFYTTKPQGLGLGLSISRSIIDAHGGRLWGTSHSRPRAPLLPALRRTGRHARSMGPWSNYSPRADLLQSPARAVRRDRR